MSIFEDRPNWWLRDHLAYWQQQLATCGEAWTRCIMAEQIIKQLESEIEKNGPEDSPAPADYRPVSSVAMAIRRDDDVSPQNR